MLQSIFSYLILTDITSLNLSKQELYFLQTTTFYRSSCIPKVAGIWILFMKSTYYTISVDFVLQKPPSETPISISKDGLNIYTY